MLDQNALEKNKTLVRNYYDECWNRGALEGLGKYISTDCRHHDPVFPSLGPGIENLRRHISMCRTGFPDLRITLDDVIAERDEVVAHWTVRGTHQGQFLGIAPTKKSASISGTSIYRIGADRIVEQFSDWNLMTLLEQLGAASMAKVQQMASR